MTPAMTKEEEKIHPDHKIPTKHLLWILCEICYEIIAVADRRELCLPLRTDMFRSPDPLHGALPPFQEGVDFEFMTCPVCNHRFAVEENRIRTQDGMITIPDELPAYEDEPTMRPVPDGGEWFSLPKQEGGNNGKEEKQSKAGQGSQGDRQKGQKVRRAR